MGKEGGREVNLDDSLYALSEAIAKLNPDTQSHGLLEGTYGYGNDFENEIFMMHPFCWCEREDCGWCGSIGAMPQLARDVLGVKFAESDRLPNFWYKPLDFKVWWYKYIGRGMEMSETLTQIELHKIFLHCHESLNSPPLEEAGK